MKARQILAWNLRRIRSSQVLSIEELADRAKLDASYLARIERGVANPSIDRVENIAEALKVPILHLLADVKAGSARPAPLRPGRRPKK
jgi:transcriptional regulator with XRE-family HTH domain